MTLGNVSDAIRRNVSICTGWKFCFWPTTTFRKLWVPRGSSAHASKLLSQLFFRPGWLPPGLRGWYRPLAVVLLKRIGQINGKKEERLGIERKKDRLIFPSALVPRGFAAHPSSVLLIYCHLQENWMRGFFSGVRLARVTFDKDLTTIGDHSWKVSGTQGNY